MSGSVELHAPPEDVFRAIRDPRVLLEVIPGCDEVERVGADEYRGRIALRLPGAVGTYRTTVALVDVEPPLRAGVVGRVEGDMGSIAGRAEFELAGAAAGTRLDYRGQAAIDGPLARLDSRFAERLAESLISQGLRALDRRLAREAADRSPGGGVPPITEVPG